jgi:hypothetical protein
MIELVVTYFAVCVNGHVCGTSACVFDRCVVDVVMLVSSKSLLL